MIFSRLDEERSFAACPHAIRKVLEYLRDTDVMALPLGRQEIDGERIILNVMDMTTRPFEGSHPEVHQQYILTWAPRRSLKPGRRGTSPCWRMWRMKASSWLPQAATVFSSPGMLTVPV